MLRLLEHPPAPPAPPAPVATLRGIVRPLAPLPDPVPSAARVRMEREAAGEVLPTNRPPLAWRLRQRWLLLTNGSYLVPLWARLARRAGLAVVYGELRGKVYHGDGTVTDYGLLSRRLITDAGVAFLASAFDNTVEPETEKYHGFGTGTTAESAGQTALVTELTTQYASSNTRPTGSQSHSSNTYTTVGTLTPTADATITEHAPFSQAANSGGTMWDRSKFTGIALVAANPDSLQATYVATWPSGG